MHRQNSVQSSFINKFFQAFTKINNTNFTQTDPEKKKRRKNSQLGYEGRITFMPKTEKIFVRS